MLQLSQATENQTTPPNLQSDFIAAAKHTHHELSRQNDLSPANDTVNRCLSDFVNAVLNFSVEKDAAKEAHDFLLQNPIVNGTFNSWAYELLRNNPEIRS